MKISRRFQFILLGLAVLGLLWVFFQPAVWSVLVVPVALVAWLVLRIFMSIDQQVWWGIIIFIGLVYVYARLATALVFGSPQQQPETNAALDSFKHWHETMLLTESDMDRSNFLKRNLATLLVSIIASEQERPVGMELFDALKQGDIEIPPEVYDFLLAEQPATTSWSLSGAWGRLRRLPRRWLDHWSGRDKAAYYRSISASLAYMEAYLEIENDSGNPRNSN
jgi:hypothetical protein